MQIEDTIIVKIGEEEYVSWPRLEIRSPQNHCGQLRCLALGALLGEDIDASTSWREQIPLGIRKAIAAMPEGHGELLLLARESPESFLQIHARSPALLMVAANYWVFEGRLTRPTDPERKAFCSRFYSAPRHESLGLSGFDTRMKVRILEKLRSADCTMLRLKQLTNVMRDKSTARRMSHLSSVNRAVLWLLESERFRKDSRLLRIAAEEPWEGCEYLGVAIQQVEHWLAQSGVEGWPYRNSIGSWATLRRIRRRLQAKCDHCDPFEELEGDVTYPNPPFSDVMIARGFGLLVKPLDSKFLLREESRQMSNCAATYGDVVPVAREFFLYRIVVPFRATLLIHRIVGEWSIEQMLGPRNAVLPRRWHLLVEEWLEAENKKLRR